MKQNFPRLLDKKVLKSHVANGMSVQFAVFAKVEELDNDKGTVLFRVALVDTRQHAKAANVSVSIKGVGQAVSMEIRDNGRSSNVAHVLDSRRDKRLGLIGMRERVEMVGGTFRAISKTGYGQSVAARIPFKRFTTS